MRILLILTFIITLASSSQAQQKWNLKTIVDYAMANNINVKLNNVQAKVAAINYNQSKLSQYPNANFSTSTSINSGNNQDPTTFSRITQTYLNAGFQLQTSADIFNFYSKRNTIAANEWELKAAGAATDKVKNDIALSAANAYLQILLSKAQEEITAVQIKQTQDQLTNTRKQVNAGALPELNATQLEAQLAQDSVNYISAKGNTTLAILTLKANLNIDAGAPFEVETPPVDKIPVEAIASLQPDYVYDLAIKNMPQQKFNDFKMKAAEKNVAAAKASMYPTLSAFGSLGTSYIASRSAASRRVITGLDTFGIVNIPTLSPVQYSVLGPTFGFEKTGDYDKTGNFFGQIDNNLQKSIGISLRVPIFNGGSAKSNYQRSKLNIETITLQKERDNQQLKQDIYQAYNSALIAYEKFNASKKSIDINELNLTYATKRFNVGMLGTFDLITTQNNLLRAKLQYTQNQFDYVFKMKVLEFYKGMGLRL
jgi:outer membrane protein